MTNILADVNRSDTNQDIILKSTVGLGISAAVTYGVSYAIGRVCNLRAHDFAKIMAITFVAKKAFWTAMSLLEKQFNWNPNTVKTVTVITTAAIGAAAIYTLSAAGVIGTLGIAILGGLQAAGILAHLGKG